MAGPAQYAAINASSSGDNIVVAAVAGKSIRVLNYTAVATAAVTATWKTGTGGSGSNVALSGPMALAANGGAAPSGGYVKSGGGDAEGVLQTAAGEALNLNLGGAVQVGGHLTYLLV